MVRERTVNGGFWRAACLCCSLVGVAACREVKDSDLTGSGSAKSELIEVTDIAVLFPLKASPSVDNAFGTEGTGICNAPQLFDGSNELISRGLFSEFVANNFGVKCPDSSISFESDEELLKDQSKHLARLKGLDSGICAFENWRIVSFRLDPCLETNPTGFCSEREARLIAQPIIEKGALRILDNALHLIYQIPDPGSIIRDLEKVAEVRKKVVSEKPWKGVDTANPRLLIPHPGLRAEMSTCGGPMASALKSFFNSHFRTENLVQIAWMTSSTGATEWTFAAENIQGGRIVSGPARKHSNFSKTQFKANKFPFNSALMLSNQDKSGGNLAELFVPEGVLGNNASSLSSDKLQILSNALNPKLLSQASDADCFTCHLADKVKQDLAKKGAAVQSLDTYPGLEIWPFFDSSKRSFENFRNFGYWTGFQFGVAQRTIAESLQDLDLLRNK